jgi:hypothetical protein
MTLIRKISTMHSHDNSALTKLNQRFRNVCTLALLGLSLAAGCSHANPLVEPAPLRTTASAEVVHQAILSGMAAKKWLMQEDQPGVITARQESRQHTLVVAIRYTQDSVSLSYVSSVNFDERRDAQGRIFIHKKYRQWTENLIAAINKNLLTGPGAPTTQATP